MPGSRKLIAFLALAASAVYVNILFNGFTQDDFLSILNSDEIHLPLRRLFWTPYSVDGLWRPLGTAFHALCFSIAGQHAWFYHLVNILTHAAVVVLLFLLFNEMLGRPRVAFLAALLFAVHPLHTEAVVAAHSLDLMATLFLVAAWLLHWRGHTIPAALCLAASLGFKETAICALPLFALADWRLQRPIQRAAYAGYALVFAAYFAMRTQVVGLFGTGSISVIHNPLVHLSAPLRAANGLHLAWLMLGLHVYPMHLAIERGYNSIPVIFNSAILAGWIVASIALFAAWWYGSRRSPVVFIAGLIYFLGSAITSNIFFPGSALFGERWAYFPSAGFCLLAALGYTSLDARWPKSATALLLLVIGALSVRTIARNRDWRDDFTLFASAVEVVPQSLKAQLGLGSEYFRRGDLVHAEEHFNAAERISPEFPTLQQQMAALKLRQGDFPAAERHMRIAMRTSAGYAFEPEVVISYAALEIQQQRYNAAEQILRVAMVSWPGRTRAYSNRALLRYYQGHPAQALADVRIALQLNPGNTQAFALLSRLHRLP